MLMTKPAISRYVYPHFLIGFVIVILLIATTEFIVQLVSENYTERQHHIVMDKSQAIRAKIEGEFNAMFYLSAGLMAHVATHPKISNKEFSAIAHEITTTGRNIRNIGLARNNIITHVYPIKGNEAALGLDYTTLKSQWPAVKKTIELKRTIVAGPLKLVQGGNALIIRTPIFTHESPLDDTDKSQSGYWGLASLVLNSDGFFKTTEFHTSQDGITFALRGKDGLGADGEMILGNEAIFDTEHELTQINLQHGEWLLAARPEKGWLLQPAIKWRIRLFGWLASIVFGTLVASLSISRQKNRELAFYDALTTLPNRRLLEDRMQQVLVYSRRYRKSFGLFYIDLDNFKQINDQLGHHAGDALLVEAAKRMQSSIRSSDTVARTGGDEFIVLINDIHKDNDMCRVRQKLMENLLSSANIEGTDMKISASIGYAVFPEDELNLAGLEQIADQRMYQEKKRKKTQNDTNIQAKLTKNS